MACALATLASDATPQAIPPAARNYLFASDVNDARALWVNPAGLGATQMASIAATMVFDTPDSADVRLGQWSVALNSRGLSFGYQRDRLITGVANEAFRLGIGRGFRRGAVGFATTFYKSLNSSTLNNETNRGFDLGVMYQLTPNLNGALLLQHIGQPEVRSVKTPFSGTASATWTPLGGRARISGEVAGANRLGGSGYDVSYRAGARLIIGSQFPLQGFTTVSMDSDLGVERWSIGVAIGRLYRLIAHGTVLPLGALPNQHLVGITGIATNPLGGTSR